MGIEAAIASAVASSLIGGASNLFTQTKTQKQPKFKRQLVDELLAGLQGEGQFASMLNADENAFQRSVVDPLMQKFNTQTAPNIQQRFIASGQQRGTPLDTALSRAGLDVQSDIDKLFLDFQNSAFNRKQNTINELLGLPDPAQQSSISPIGGAVAGLQASGALPEIIQFIINQATKTPKNAAAATGFSDNTQAQPESNFQLPSFLETPRRGFN